MNRQPKKMRAIHVYRERTSQAKKITGAEALRQECLPCSGNSKETSLAGVEVSKER